MKIITTLIIVMATLAACGVKSVATTDHNKKILNPFTGKDESIDAFTFDLVMAAAYGDASMESCERNIEFEFADGPKFNDSRKKFPLWLHSITKRLTVFTNDSAIYISINDKQYKTDILVSNTNKIKKVVLNNN